MAMKSNASLLISFSWLILKSSSCDCNLVAIFFGGFESYYKPHIDELFPIKITTPTIHVYGERDDLVLSERSLALSSHFVDPIIVAHNGGYVATISFIYSYLSTLVLCRHHVPSNAPSRNAIISFLNGLSESQIGVGNPANVRSIN